MFTTRFLDLPPIQSAAGTVRLPGSKSISNRVLLLAALAQGTTVIEGLLEADDTAVMLEALRGLGCDWRREGSQLIVPGLAGRLPVREADLFLGNAGTAMRPLAAVLALLAARDGGRYSLRGVPRMHERPIGDLVDALRALGLPVQCLDQEGYPPLQLSGPTQPRLDAPVRVRGDVSSQFLTALLMALPLLATERAIVIEVEGELISKPYIAITLALLAQFGVQVQREGWQRFTLAAGSRLVSPGTWSVEGDASAASYFIGLGALAATAAPLCIEGAGSAALQGDVAFVEAARAMGALIDVEPQALRVRRGRWPLQGIDWDCIAIPDAAMTLAVMALFADSPTRLRGIGSWRVKETDRIAAMATELRKLGAQVDEGEDWLRVHPLPPHAWRRAALHTYDDHRMAMCFSLASANGLCAAAPVPVRVLDPKCVAKTYPNYFEAFFGLVQVATSDIPVLCVDGPTASGKGTLAEQVAQALGFSVLDSGALYRATALAAQRAGVALDDEPAVAALAACLPLRFAPGEIWLGQDEISQALRAEAVGLGASAVAALPAVRAALHELQLGFRRLPGLVADGRDMGTTIFPDAPLKVFLTASAEQRAERRHKQLISKGFSANIEGLLADLRARDARDSGRSASPLKAAADAKRLDNSSLSIQACVAQVLDWWDEQQRFPR